MKTGQHFTSLVVFGDGLSDMGRWGKLTNYQYPPAIHGFYESRWTNGKVWIEHVADSLGLALSFSNNFAMGGATTGQYNINEALRDALKLDRTVPLPGMLSQVQNYLDTQPAINEQTLFVLWAGGHDIGNYLDYSQPDLAKYPPAGNYRAAVEMLIAAGAKQFLLGTMPDMGFTPVYYGTDKQSLASELCNNLNIGLRSIQSEYSSKGIQLILLDGARVFAEVGANPAKFGFTHTDAYLPFNIIDFAQPLTNTNIPVPNKEQGLNPDVFMNWWAVSASAQMHRIIATEALRVLKQK